MQEEEPLRIASSESRAFLLGTCFGEGGGGVPVGNVAQPEETMGMRVRR